MVKADDESKTIETRLDFDKGVFDCIELLLRFFASVRGKVWRELVIKKENPNELKSALIRVEKVTARHANSLIKEVQAKATSIEELRKERRIGLARKIKSTERKIASLDQRIKVECKTLKDIESYRQKIKAWKNRENLKPKKKPQMLKSIRHKFSVESIKTIKRLKFMRHQKMRHLNILSTKLRELQTPTAPSMCFGGKKLFHNQHHLDEAGYKSHDEWLEVFRDKRSASVFFIGSSDESFGNQSFQYDPKKKTLQIRLPNAPEFSSQGKYLIIENVEFPDNLKDAFLEALAPPSNPRSKTQRSSRPVSYRLVRRINRHTMEKSYYVQASFAPHAPEIVSNQSLGAIGVDINADHIAITETDRFGNYLNSLSLPFDFTGKSSDQVKAIIGDLSSVLIGLCEKTGKPLVMENLDFSEKKASLRELALVHRKMLSSFAYSKFIETIQSRGRKQGIEVILINPAYTSLIGAYKFQGLNISTHEKAAFAIARRGQGYSEAPEVHKGTLPPQVMMEEKARFQASSRHVLGFYADNRGKIRELLIRADSRPTQLSERALSLAKEHPSLARSFAVILDRPSQLVLHRASG